jgi:hypothetical protein
MIALGAWLRHRRELGCRTVGRRLMSRRLHLGERILVTLGLRPARLAAAGRPRRVFVPTRDRAHPWGHSAGSEEVTAALLPTTDSVRPTDSVGATTDSELEVIERVIDEGSPEEAHGTDSTPAAARERAQVHVRHTSDSVGPTESAELLSEPQRKLDLTAAAGASTTVDPSSAGLLADSEDSRSHKVLSSDPRGGAIEGSRAAQDDANQSATEPGRAELDERATPTGAANGPNSSEQDPLRPTTDSLCRIESEDEAIEGVVGEARTEEVRGAHSVPAAAREPSSIHGRHTSRPVGSTEAAALPSEPQWKPDPAPAAGAPATVFPSSARLAAGSEDSRSHETLNAGPHIGAIGEARSAQETLRFAVPDHIAEVRMARRPVSSVVDRGSAITQKPDVVSQTPPRPASEGAQAVPLFAARETGRSPQAWLARLRSQADSEHSVVPGPVAADVRPGATSAPPSEVAVHRAGALGGLDRVQPLDATRRFIRPLVGVDPADVRIHRGRTDPLTVGTESADALTVGDEVVVAASHDERTAAGRGLLAHEITHVARRHYSRFVPPVARLGARAGLGGEGGNSSSSAAAHAHEDDEAIALRVESRVRAAAERPAVPTAASPGPEVTPLARYDVGRDVESSTEPVGNVPAPLEPASKPHGGNPPWGTLPAPWEPVAHGLPQPPGVLPDALQGSRAVSEAGSLGMAATGAGKDIAVAAAAHQRRVDAPPAPAVRDPTDRAGLPEPDLDALARRVYDVIRRRLAAEQRRVG